MQDLLMLQRSSSPDRLSEEAHWSLTQREPMVPNHDEPVKHLIH